MQTTKKVKLIGFSKYYSKKQGRDYYNFYVSFQDPNVTGEKVETYNLPAAEAPHIGEEYLLDIELVTYGNKFFERALSYVASSD